MWINTDEVDWTDTPAAGEVFKAVLPLEFSWNPKEDITPYELAMCTPLLISLTLGRGVFPNQLGSETWLRNFDIRNPNEK